MNKLTKIGVSALCGSLAAVSAAHAGDMSVSGSATATWIKKDHGVVGNPLGMASGLTFKGSGELDNGNTFSLEIAHDDQNAWSAAQISMDVAGIGTIKLDNGGGTGIDRLDDKMPSAKEESYDTGISSGMVTVTGAGGSTDIEWTVDSGMVPVDGLAAYISYSPRADGTAAKDKAGGGAANSHKGSGWDVVLEYAGIMDGLNVFGGYSVVDQESAKHSGDLQSKVLGATYAIGGITVGYQYSKETIGAHAGTNYYENDAFGISFNVNDDLSISYGVHQSDRKIDAGTSVELETESMQLAYSLGGATIAVAQSEANNAAYSANTDYEATTVWLSLAF
jgi:hypothetical protein